MKHRLNINILLLLLASLPVSAFAVQVQAMPWFVPTDLPLDPRYHDYQLDNGLRVIMVDNNRPKQGVSIRMLVDAGSFQAPASKLGVAHFLEHMAFNGSKHVVKDEMVAILERHGLAFGADTNASTSMTNTTYQLDLPRTDKESIDTALFLLREIASQLRLDQAAITKERQIIEAEIRTRQSAQFSSLLDSIDYIYAGTDLAEKIAMGSIKGIETVNKKALTDFYQRYYAPQNTTLILVGNIAEKPTLERVKHYFSDWQNPRAKPAVDPTFNLIYPQQTQTRAFVSANTSTEISVSIVAPETALPSRQKSVIEEWMYALAQAALRHRLDNAMYEHAGKVLSSSVNSEADFGIARVSTVAVSMSDNDWPLGLSLIEHTLRQALEFGFTPAEIQRELDALHKALQLSVATATDRTNSDLAQGIVNAVDQHAVILSPQFSLSLFNNNLDAFSVNAINAAFKKRWSSSSPRIYLTTPQAQKNIEHALLATYQASQKVTLVPWIDHATSEFAYRDFGKPGQAQRLAPLRYGNIQRYRFNNGVKLNVKQTDVEKNVVYISVHVGKGKMALTEPQYPLVQLYDAGMAAGGLKKHDVMELSRIFSGSTTGIATSMTDNALTFEQVVKKEDTLDQLRILTALLTDGGYREEGKAFAIKSVEEYLNTYQNSPDEVLAGYIEFKLHGSDRRWSMPSVAALQSFSMSDLKPMVENAIAKGPVEIGIVGDISPQDAADDVAQTFGALAINADEKEARLPIPSLAIKSEKVILHHKGEDNTALISGYWALPDASDEQQSFQFLLLENVIRNRITQAVRESIGAAYSPWVARQQSYEIKNFGYLSINSNTTVERVDQVFEVYKQVLTSLQRTVISDDELNRAAAPLIAAVRQQPDNNHYWFNLASIAQGFPEIITAQSHMLEALSLITKEDILATANKIKINDALQVQVLPYDAKHQRVDN
ncbi:insulinase family protein [Shewanella sp.]|nr:insulinase family protein [Shewanella sp.]